MELKENVNGGCDQSHCDSKRHGPERAAFRKRTKRINSISCHDADAVRVFDYPTVVVARAASDEGEGEGDVASGDCRWVFGVLLGLKRLLVPLEMMAGGERRPSELDVGDELVPFLLSLLFRERMARSESSVSEVLLLLRDILLVDSDISVDFAAATGLAGRPAMPLSVSTPARTRLAGEGPPLAASNKAAATGLGGRLGLEPLCWRL